jgi:hypothetical protein
MESSDSLNIEVRGAGDTTRLESRVYRSLVKVPRGTTAMCEAHTSAYTNAEGAVLNTFLTYRTEYGSSTALYLFVCLS